MTIAILLAASGLIFLALDALMLSLVIGPLFRQHLGAALLDTPRLLPAASFYVIYMLGLLHFVSLPALRSGARSDALVNGFLLGLLAYGTYELTSYAVMRDWHPSMAIADMAWGGVLTAVSAWGGVAIARSVG